MRCYCFLRNVNDIQFYGTTPYFRRYGTQFKGHCIPFGAEVGFMKFDAQVVANVLSIPIPNVLESLEQAERDGIVRDIVDEDRIFAFRSNVYREAVLNKISSIDKDKKCISRSI